MSLSKDEILEAQKKERAFVATPIGAAFNKFKLAIGAAYVTDTNAGWAENVSDKRLREVWERANAAETELRALIEPLALANGEKPQ